METRTFGNTGMEVGMLGFGAAEIGFQGTDDRTLDTLLGVALDLGINVIDTAAMYADSEEKLGRCLRGRRNQFLLFTKCGRFVPPRTTVTGFCLRAQQKWLVTTGRHDSYESIDWHPAALAWDIDQSLRRLRTDRIDLILLHTCSEGLLHRGACIEKLQRAREAGKVLHLGYSGDGEAAGYAIRCGYFGSVELSINIADQQALDTLVPLAKKYEVGIIAKRPIANGIWRSRRMPGRHEDQVYWERLRELDYDFLETGEDFATALRFTLSVPGVHTAIVGTTNPAHMRANAESIMTSLLDESQFRRIRSQWQRTARRDWIAQT